MSQKEQRFCLEVWGDYACFTRPEMKVERVSYDVITPSAARAVFETILWKPAIRWHIREIEILNPIKWVSVRRNEVGAVANEKKDAILIEDNRQQRAGLFLRDVRYRLHAYLEYIPVAQRKHTRQSIPTFLWDSNEMNENQEAKAAWSAKKDENPGKYLAMFERRAKKGQCFVQPYLGCREFSAYFELIEHPKETPAIRINETRDLGFMLYDMDFSDPEDPRPAFYRPKMEQGKITVPPWDSEEVRK
jgi:CRISPR-associated protein Cas5d